MNPDHPSAYTPHQISQYCKFIDLPTRYHPTATTKPALNLEFLTILHAHQISTVPYENLSLHYSKDRSITLDPQFLFDKFLTRKRGGYCLETSIFYNHVLRALGFQVYTAAVRIRLRKDGVPYGRFEGWRHIVNIVTLADPSNPSNQIKYMIDVGFGGDGATKPLPLIHDKPQHNLGTQTIRLIHDVISDQVDQSDTQKLWIFQYRNAPDKPWNTYYAFPEVEYSELEFDTLNFWLVNHPGSFQRQIVLIIKFLRGNQGRDEQTRRNGDEITMASNGVDVPWDDLITGKLMLVDGLVKRNLGGKTEVVAELKTEEERVAAIRKWFGLVLTEEEVGGIKGHWTELREKQLI